MRKTVLFMPTSEPAQSAILKSAERGPAVANCTDVRCYYTRSYKRVKLLYDTGRALHSAPWQCLHSNLSSLRRKWVTSRSVGGRSIRVATDCHELFTRLRFGLASSPLCPLSVFLHCSKTSGVLPCSSYPRIVVRTRASAASRVKRKCR